jgi:hypothetical protein
MGNRVARSAPLPHPDPPLHLSQIELPVTLLYDLQPTWWRLYGCNHNSSLHWGRAVRYRFDDPHGAYGVLYLGADVCCAFIETFGDSRGPAGTLELAEKDLSGECLATVTVPQDLQVVDLTGAGLANIGADARLTAGDNYPQSRLWSRALWEHPSKPNGIYYRARHDPERFSVALFHNERSAAVIEELRGPLSSPSNIEDLTDILRAYTVSLL